MIVAAQGISGDYKYSQDRREAAVPNEASMREISQSLRQLSGPG